MELKPFANELNELHLKMQKTQEQIQDQVLYALSMLEFVLQ
jgi:hypothetical protein